MSDDEVVSKQHLGSFPCPECNSTDNLQVWAKETESGEDFVDGSCMTPNCKKYWSNNELINKGVLSGDLKIDKNKMKAPKKPITKEEALELLKKTDMCGRMPDGSQYRGLPDWVLEFYGHRIERNKKGEIIAEYYPETEGGKLQGYKSRHLPKKFGINNLGKTGGGNDLSGQHKFPNGGKYLIIVGGECDKCAAQAMFREYQKSRGNSEYDHYAVVSPTTGEGSAASQVARNYDFVDSFENIVVCMDMDEAGKEAAKSIVKVLPKEKAKVMKLSGKDPNQMLIDGKHKQFISNFFNAKSLIETVVKTSKQADDEMEIELGRKSIPLPPFMSGLEKAMAGGIRLGYLVVIASGTGLGKTTIVNEMIYHWIFNSPYKVGILTLEANAGQYQSVLLSRHIGKNINTIDNPIDRVVFVQQDWVVEKRKELRENEFGEHRYSLLDERDGSLEEVKRQTELMVKRDGCHVVIIDPIQDLFEGTTLEEQTAFIKWIKAFIKKGYTIIAIAHVTKGKTEIDRKTGKRVMRLFTEDDLAGVSNLAKSSGCTVFTSRDKYAECPIERNTTYPVMGKCRWSGFSGDIDPWYYDKEKHTMFDKKSYIGDSSTEEGGNESFEVIL